MSTELLAACDEVEALYADYRPDDQLLPALRRALDLGLIAAARRGVEAEAREQSCVRCSVTLLPDPNEKRPLCEDCYLHYGEYDEAEEGETR